MRWTSLTLVFLAASCDQTSKRSVPPATTMDASPATMDASPAPPSPKKPSADGRCQPTPKEDSPCHEEGAFCVISWGTPGGRSAALFCREGRWIYEEEQNLP